MTVHVSMCDCAAVCICNFVTVQLSVQDDACVHTRLHVWQMLNFAWISLTAFGRLHYSKLGSVPAELLNIYIHQQDSRQLLHCCGGAV